MIKSLQYFQNTKLPVAVAQLFKDLDVPLNLSGDAPARIGSLLENNDRLAFSDYVGDVFLVGLVDDNAFEGIKSGTYELANIRGKNYDTILVFALEIKRLDAQGQQALPTRTQLFDLARAFNREFPYQPVVLVFRYAGLASIAVVERNDYKAKHLVGDKIGKMSLLRDVDLLRPHAGHLRILKDMEIPRSGKNAVTTFDSLYRHWQAVLNVSVLNKKFYQELSNWYFWAVHHVRFPGEPTHGDAETLKTHRANNVIRLITRLIFTWFLKEKKLVPDTLFDLDELAADHLRFQTLTPDNSTSSEYYLAILQNLFFATLNQEMGARRFKLESKAFPHPDHTIKNVYRHAALFKNADAAADLFKDVPFLNGGLFECLDEEDKKSLVDGFSDSKSKQPTVPNFLFFQKDPPPADELNDDYGTKNKKYEVRGLLHILNDYKFTIAENTPLEEEVALDPELLGRIFENLLASYNPETKTTARKQTGSFYTPREIVQYMVDESLMAYLKNKLTESWLGREAELDQNLRQLFAETEAQPFSDEADKADLIAALDACKILDPACGSGAFPMGILRRMVALLHRLDPSNRRWKKRQLDKAAQIDDANSRQKATDAIERAFDRSELDYGRKLFLIEYCIYGVDIQPIAVQIAKLRFFISLICDQNAEPIPPDGGTEGGLENRGIIALPNLETKFVAANTLIGLENANLAKMAVEDLLKQRENLRHHIFSADRFADKKAYRKKDERLREQIKAKLDTLQMGGQSDQLADWNPFDQNASAPFFDPQWMFGIEKGFDVVIGNPPYVQLQKIKEQSVQLQKQGFATFSKAGDIYCLFYEKALQILRPGGSLAYITSNSWMKTQYGQLLRGYFAKNSTPLALLNFEDTQLFEAAIVETNILIARKGRSDTPLRAAVIGADADGTMPLHEILAERGMDIRDLSEKEWIIGNAESTALKLKMENAGKRLGDWDVVINYGIKTGFNEAFIISETTKNVLIAEDPVSAELLRPVLRGRDLKKYSFEFGHQWLIYSHAGVNETDYKVITKQLAVFKDQLLLRRGGMNQKTGEVPYEWWQLQVDYYNSGAYKNFSKPKIIWGDMSDTANFSFDEKGYFTNDKCFIMTGNGLKYLLGILNSKASEWYFNQISTTSGMGTTFWKKYKIEQLPIPEPEPQKAQTIEQVVDLILHAKSHAHPAPLPQAFERVLDGMVCELYFGELMREQELDILGQVEKDLAPYAAFGSLGPAEKDAAVERLHGVWSHPESVVRNRLALMPVRSAEVLGVILGGK